MKNDNLKQAFENFADIIKPGHLLLRRCGKIDYVVSTTLGFSLVFNIESHEHYNIDYEIMKNGKHPDTRDLDVIEIIGTMPIEQAEVIWREIRSDTYYYRMLTENMVQLQMKQRPVFNVIDDLVALGVNSYELVYNFGFETETVQEYFRRKDKGEF